MALEHLRQKQPEGRIIYLYVTDSDARLQGVVPTRRGNRSDRYAPQGVYPCAGRDSWCALSVQTGEQWQALARLLGKDEWTTDRRFETVAQRIEAHDEIDQAIADWTRRFSSAETEQRLCAAGLAARRVRRIDEAIDHPGGATVFTAMPERRVGAMQTTRLPFSFSCMDLPAPRSAPSLGEHSEEALRAWLNCSDAEIAELRRREVLR